MSKKKSKLSNTMVGKVPSSLLLSAFGTLACNKTVEFMQDLETYEILVEQIGKDPAADVTKNLQLMHAREKIEGAKEKGDPIELLAVMTSFKSVLAFQEAGMEVLFDLTTNSSSHGESSVIANVAAQKARACVVNYPGGIEWIKSLIRTHTSSSNIQAYGGKR
jgi:hypothetical protein